MGRRCVLPPSPPCESSLGCSSGAPKRGTPKPGLTLATVAPDQPLRLSTAAALAFPDGSMTASGLRREADRGRLAIERIAGKDFTTLTAIAEMREKCRVPAKVQGCGFAQSGVTRQANSNPTPRGSSSMQENISPQDALRAKLQLRKVSSPSISPPSTPLHEPSAN